MQRLRQFGWSMTVLGIIFMGVLSASQVSYARDAYPLHTAVKKNDLSALKGILGTRADVNRQDARGWTPLMYAVQAGLDKQVKLLLKAGALPDVADKLGRTPLELATRAPARFTRLLVQAKANVNIRNAGGIPVIMTAAGEGRQDLVEILLGAGARLDYKDYQGNTIMDWVERANNPQLKAFLLPRFRQAVATTHTESGEDFVEDMFADAVHPEWFELSYLDLDEDLTDALQEGKKGLMVYFGLKRCSYCQAFLENTLTKPDIEKRVRGMFNVVGLDIFSDNEMKDPTGKAYLVKDFVTAKKANYSPTMIFYGKNGREMLKIVGYYPPDKFRHVLNYLENGNYRYEKLSTYINRNKEKKSIASSSIKRDVLFPNNDYTLYRKKKPASRPLVVLFEQPDCEACDRFHQRVLTDKPIRRLLKQFDTLQLDATDTKTAVVTPAGSRIAPKTWYSRLGLSYNPAMIFYDEAGNEITRLDSETKRWRMEGTLQLILEKSYTHDTQVQRWRRDKAVEFYTRKQ